MQRKLENVWRGWSATALLLCVTLNQPGADAAQTGIAKGHQVLQAGKGERAVAVGEQLPALRFEDLEGNGYRVGEGTRGDVFLFLSTECPVAKRYTERLKRLAAAFAGEGFRFFSVHANSQETADQIRHHHELLSLPFPVVQDRLGNLVRLTGAVMTPEAAVVDARGKLRYRGALDDNRYESRVKEDYLKEALTALAVDRPVRLAETGAIGCTIHLSEAAELGEVTFSKHIAPIIQDNCQTCHRPGQVAPFSLMNYRQVKAWSTEVQAYTRERLMPPWKAEPGFGEFKHDRSLSQHEIDLISRWVAGGCPEGDRKDLPPPRDFPEGWMIGEPDMIVEMPEEYVIGPEGEDDYRHFIIPTALGGDRYVRAVDVRPGNMQTVHHVILYTDTAGKARQLDEADPGPGYTNFGGPGLDPDAMLGGWAPGTFPVPAPDGTGTLLREGADIVMQVHYYRTGVEERDRTRVGLYFSEHPRPKRLDIVPVLNREFVIPAGAARHGVVAEHEVRRDVYAISVYPHMHLLGREMKVTARLPMGEVKSLIWIKNWDFSWQGDYFFKEPLLFPTGTRIIVEAYFDNSEENPNNPNHPPVPVRWGDKTTDEMCLAFVGVVGAEGFEPGSSAGR